MSRFALRCRPFAIVFALFILVVSLLSALDRKFERVLNAAMSVPAAAGATPSASSARLAKDYGKLPISFEVNQGQTDQSVQFLARGAGYTLFLRPGEAVLSLHTLQANAGKPAGAVVPGTLRHTPKQLPAATPASTVRLQLIGSNTTAEATGIDPLPGKSNYLIGNDPVKWHTDVPTYAKVRYRNVYPSIDLLYYGNQEGRLEHDFVVAPGGDPNQIVFELRDEDGTPALNGSELTLHTKAGDINLRAPVAYQVIGGERRPVAATYQAAGSGHIGFRVESYDRQYPLLIDPVLVYSSVFGDLGGTVSIAVDTARNVYVIGYTYSNASSPASAVVSKLNSSGTALVYSTYLGGNSSAEGIAVDASGRAYVSGWTHSGFPIVNAYQPTFGGFEDAFIAVLNPAGNALEWSTYLGGMESDVASAIALDPSGNVYVTGITQSWSFPRLHSIPGGTQCQVNSQCIWVAKFNSAGKLQYATIYSNGSASAVAADSNGSAYITGDAYIAPPPTTPGAFRSTCSLGSLGNGCVYVAKLSPTGDSLVYSTTLGDTQGHSAGIAVDSGGNAYVAGYVGLGLPVWSTGFRTYGGGNWDGMVIKLNATGTNLIWSTYLGGSGEDWIQALALDQYRQVYVTGSTTSADFPLKSPIQLLDRTGGYSYQSFVATLSPSLSSIQYYSTYFGLGTNFRITTIAVDPALNVYVAGNDYGQVQPTPGAYSTGSTGTFISKLVIMDDLSLTLNASPSPVPHGSNLTYTMAVTSKGPDFGVNVRVSDTLPSGTTFVSYDAGGGTCTAPPVGSTGTLNCVLPQLNKGATWNVKLTVNVVAGSGTTLSNTAATISNMQDFVISNNSAVITTPVH